MVNIKFVKSLASCCNQLHHILHIVKTAATSKKEYLDLRPGQKKRLFLLATTQSRTPPRPPLGTSCW
jgi:hypothetical protein